jgi:hypothetical protein
MTGSTTVASGNGNFSFSGNATGTGTVNAVASDGQQTSGTSSVQIVIKPTLTLALTYIIRNEVELNGVVTDPSPGGLTVTFTGVVQGSAVTNSDGTFSATYNASGVGDITAKVTDGAGQTSDPATVTVTDTAPSISNFYANHQSGTTWVLAGSVMAQSVEGLTVTFVGLQSVQNVTATTNADGTFSVTVTLQAGEGGVVGANCTDWFGLKATQVNTGVN